MSGNCNSVFTSSTRATTATVLDIAQGLINKLEQLFGITAKLEEKTGDPALAKGREQLGTLLTSVQTAASVVTPQAVKGFVRN